MEPNYKGSPCIQGPRLFCQEGECSECEIAIRHTPQCTVPCVGACPEDCEDCQYNPAPASKVLWRKEHYLGYMIVQIEETSTGLIVITLDPEAGWVRRQVLERKQP